MRYEKKIRRTRLVIGGAVLATLPMLGASAVHAAPITYFGAQGINGNWNSSGSWVTGSNTSLTNADTYPLASNSDFAFLEPTGTNNETINVTDSEGCAEVLLAPAIGTSATLNVTGSGVLTLNGSSPLNNGGGSSHGVAIVNVTNGGTLTNAGTGAVLLGTAEDTNNSATMTLNIGGGLGTSTFIASSASTAPTCLIGNYCSASCYVDTGGSFIASGNGAGSGSTAGIVYVGYGNYTANANTGTSYPQNDLLQLNGGSFSVGGGTVGGGNGTGVVICRNTNGGETGLVQLISGSFSTTGSVAVGADNAASSVSAPIPAANATFEVEGSTMSVIDLDTNGIATGATATIGLDLQPGTLDSVTSTSMLKIGLDAGGSTLINVTGSILMTNTTLDIDALPGFTGAGNVPGEPGWYRLASYTGTLTDSTGLTLASDNLASDGYSYSLVPQASDPGYLTIDVVSVPEPASLFALTSLGVGLLFRRRRAIL
jgi:hypothetical protein